MSPTNRAALLITKAEPLEVRETTYTHPDDDQIVVKSMALAINPFDYIIQDAFNITLPHAKLPFILGTDVSGEVVEVGKKVTRFRVGDRVVGIGAASSKEVNRNCEGSLQEYVVLRQHLVSIIPANMSYEAACVLPLGLATAACALFQKDTLALPFPSTLPTPSGKTVLVWGSSSSVGCNAIQLARAAGCEVIATASPRNHDLLKRLGAAEVFDYNSPTVLSDIVGAFKNRVSAGAISIGDGSFNKCVDIMAKCNGTKFVAQASFELPPFPKSTLGLVPFIFSTMGSMMASRIRTSSKGVKSNMFNTTTVLGNGVGKAVFEDFLGPALEQNKFIPAPEPQVVGKGLEKVQEAFEICRKGVSARKIVVTI